MSRHSDAPAPDRQESAAAEPSTADSAEAGAPTKTTERPHPLTPLIRGWVVLLVIGAGLVREAIPQGDQQSNVQKLINFGVQWLVLGIVVIIAIAAAAGFVSWYYTRFVIDDDELRIETGALAKKSRRIAFDRVQSVDVVQPLAARIFGLVELRIEVGGGGSGSKLRYLTRSQATHIRDFLLARAHGDQVTFEAAGAMPESSMLTDLSPAEHPLVKIGPQTLVFGFLLSSEFLVALVIAVVLIIVSIISRTPVVGLATIIPWAFAAFGLISRHVLAQFNYTLTESVRGLRISRGLTNLTTQSLPIDRIQGVRIAQSLLWRPAGWYRVDVDVLGYGSSSERNENNTDVSSILLPVATWGQVQTALARILPGANLDEPPLRRAPTRARVLRPFDGWTLRYGWDDEVVIARHGFLINTSDVVPHSKTQSVRITRGPLQRRLRLATVHVDTPKGPVSLAAKHLGQQSARQLALTQLDRARAARRNEQTNTAAHQGQTDDAILARFGIPDADPLGSGQESRVYPLDEDRVLRIYRPGHESADQLVDQLERAYRTYAQQQIGIELPQILESGHAAGRFYTVDRRLSGSPLTRWLPSAPIDRRRQTLIGYLQAATVLGRLPIPEPTFGRLFGSHTRSFATLPELIRDQLVEAQQLIRRQGRDLPDGVVDRVVGDLHSRECVPALVHGDYCPGNVFGTEVDGRMQVTGVAAFSPHTLAADPLMDVAGAITLLELEDYDEAAADASWMHEQAIGMLADRFAPSDLEHWLDVYRRYYAIYFSIDDRVYPWAMSLLLRAEQDPSNES